MNYNPTTLTKLLDRLNFGRLQDEGPSLPSYILMTDEARLPDPLAIIPALPRGGAVLLRHYTAPARAALAHAMAPLCRRHNIRLLIAGDARLALAVGADGFHLPEAMLHQAPHRWRSWRKRHWIVTAAAHSPAALQAAARLGADAALLSPVFPTASHPDVPTLGVTRLARWSHASPLPVYALGGISALNIRRLTGSQIVGIAGIGALVPKSGKGA